MTHKWHWLLIAFLAIAFSWLASGLTPHPSWATDDSADTSAESADADENGEEAEEDAAEEDATPEPEITLSDDGVTIHAVNVYAHRLFTRLADRTGLQLIVDNTIKDRTVTVHLSDKSPWEIVDYIVSAYGFSCGEVAGIRMISEGIPRHPSSYLLSDIESIPTQYVEASDAKSLLPVFLQDHVKVNYEQNAVVLSAPTDVLQKFRQDIQQFDIPAEQIMLQVRVVEVSDWRAAQYDLGLRWQNAGRGAEWGTLALPQDNRFLPERSVGEVFLRGVADLPNEFRVRLEALTTDRQARVVAEPSIATVSGRRASFFVGIQRYLRQPIEEEWGGTSNYIDAGVRLNITPWTGDGEVIICEVRAEVSTLSALDPVTGLPEKSTRTADTMVRVRAGETIIIGGLRQNEQRHITSRVPLLGDLPLIGHLFRSRRTFTSRTDLVIFITPRVLSRTGHLPAEEEAELHERFLEDR